MAFVLLDVLGRTHDAQIPRLHQINCWEYISESQALTIGLEESEEVKEDQKAKNRSLYIQQKVMLKHRETGVMCGGGKHNLPQNRRLRQHGGRARDSSPAAALRRKAAGSHTRSETPPEQLHLAGDTIAFPQRSDAEMDHQREESFAGESWFHGSPKAGGSMGARNRVNRVSE